MQLNIVGAIVGTVFLARAASCGVSETPAGMLYVLQPDTMSATELAQAGFDWLVLEPSRDGTANGEFSPAEIEAIRTSGPCPTIVLAYLSVGEAESYRDYFDPGWIDQNGDPVGGVAPDWLGPTNPDWEGNYKIRYWDPGWQAIMFGTGTGPDITPLERIVNMGFDGVYLDIVDAYEFWSSPAGGSELTRMQARGLMIDFVEAIGTHARQTLGAQGFLVFPQNASDIIRDDDDLFDADTERYFAAIDGIGQEDLYYDELSVQPPVDVTYVLDQLREYAARGKTVVVTDYVIDQDAPGPVANGARASDFHARVRVEGFIPYAAYRDRALDEIVTTTQPAWSVSQPTDGCAASVGVPAVSVWGTMVLALLFVTSATVLLGRKRV